MSHLYIIRGVKHQVIFWGQQPLTVNDAVPRYMSPYQPIGNISMSILSTNSLDQNPPFTHMFQAPFRKEMSGIRFYTSFHPGTPNPLKQSPSQSSQSFISFSTFCLESLNLASYAWLRCPKLQRDTLPALPALPARPRLLSNSTFSDWSCRSRSSNS